jgi:hypothetical protein
MGVRCGKDCNKRTGIDQYCANDFIAAQDRPNPSKWALFVLRSAGAFLTTPIRPFFLAVSYAVTAGSSSASCRSTARDNQFFPNVRFCEKNCIVFVSIRCWIPLVCVPP